ncbi:hypothetical protein [Sulfurospirillum barnesii]|uniref:FdhC protein n=1 Tax=Sulfurospirillum barnesii (strain ATCC 700032 / DSM 10660 / SES-3) TaxID=760154 RepID=I3XVC6_SULBS|nr:hypothetical protein [Sulfurospirillum barnesii]AFL67900.1 hypothetical protein Sulba_0591 [Sulfurospirillum barnesii SES-3]
MGMKRYFLISLIYMLAIGLYVYSFNGESYALELFGLSFTLPVAFWIVLPVFFLAIASMGHLVFYNFKDFLYKRAWKKDSELFHEAAKNRILGEIVNVSYKTEGFKFAGKMLQAMKFDPSVASSFLEEDIASVSALAVSIQNGNYEDLKKYKLSKENPLVIQNTINRLKIEPKYAIEVLKNCKELKDELCQKAYATLLDFASFNEIKRYNFPIDKPTFRRMLERYLDSDDSFEMDIKSIEEMLTQLNAERSDYVELARKIKVKFSPDALIALFEKLYNSKGSVAADAYLYVLYDVQMIDKIREILLNADAEEFVKFRTLLFLRDNGKSIDINTFLNA